MRDLTIFFLLLLVSGYSAKAQKTDNSFVFDYEYVLSDKEETSLDSIFKLHETKTTNQIALVTTPDYGKESNMLHFAVEFGNSHGVGVKGKDNGVVIVFSNTLKETRIGTGLGTERVLKDEIAKSIIDSIMIPKFRKGQMFEGLFKGSEAIIEFLERPPARKSNKQLRIRPPTKH